MKHNPLFAALAALIVASAAAEAPVQGQTAASVADEPAFGTDFSIEAVSDYRDRGISLSGFDPALQPSLTVTHASGIYVNAWGSNIADYGGADVEADLSLGWSGDLAEGTTVDVYATYILYPGASRLNYAEFGASLGRTIGAGSIAANLVYAPAQDGLDNLDNVYVGLSGEVPVAGTRLLLRGSLGFEDGAFGDDKIDWLVGGEYDLGQGFAAGVNYVDSYRSRLREGRAGVVANLRYEF